MESYGRIAYTRYCEAVGGFAWNGDKLPTWEEMCADPKKAKLVSAWDQAADAVFQYIMNAKTSERRILQVEVGALHEDQIEEFILTVQ